MKYAVNHPINLKNKKAGGSKLVDRIKSDVGEKNREHNQKLPQVKREYACVRMGAGGWLKKGERQRERERERETERDRTKLATCHIKLIIVNITYSILIASDTTMK